MDVVDDVEVGPKHPAAARVPGYRPPRYLGWSLVDPIPLVGTISGAYRISGERSALVELELNVDRRSLVGFVLTPALRLFLGRLAEDMLGDVRATVESRPWLVPTPTERTAIPVTSEAGLEQIVHERLVEGRIYAFRVSRDVLTALHAAAGEHGPLAVSTSTLTEMARAVVTANRRGYPTALGLRRRSSRGARPLEFTERWASRTGRRALAEHARGAHAALDAVVATDFLTTADAAR